MKSGSKAQNCLGFVGVAFVAIAMMSAAANAQYQAQDGHATDANNRMGSGGANAMRTTGTGVTSNDIVNRNVTGLREFQGPVGARDARSFSGPVASPGFEQFIRQSYGVSDAAAGIAPTAGPRQFYGDSRFVAPPTGSLPLGFTGGYISTTINTPSSLANGLNTAPVYGLQTRALETNSYLQPQNTNGNGFSELLSNLGTPGNANAYNTTGLRLTLPMANNLGPQVAEPMSLDDVARMRQEIRDSAFGEKPTIVPTPTPGNPANPAVPQDLNAPLNAPMKPGLDVPVDSQVQGRLTSPEITSSAVNNTGIIPANVGARPSLVPPELQSTLLDTLQKRLEQSSPAEKLAADARAARTATAQRQVATPAQVPGADQGPVESLAIGIKARGLHDLMSDAEELEREGKFDESITRYGQAEHVAPNNSLTQLGRAHAELGAGYYARAENDLRAIIRSHPEMLLAQFNLAKMLPKDRVDFIEKDLKELTKSDADSERPWLLLAYLHYNTGHADVAAEDLKQADLRTARGDWLIRAMRQRWNLTPSTPGAATPGGAAPIEPAAPSTPAPSPTPTPGQQPDPLPNK